MKDTATNSRDVRLSYRSCRHLISGRTAIPKTCIYNYECHTCAFDQWLDELDARQEPLAAAA